MVVVRVGALTLWSVSLLLLSVIPSIPSTTVVASVIQSVASVISLIPVTLSINTRSHCYIRFYFVLESSTLKEEKLLVVINPLFNGLVLVLLLFLICFLQY